MALLTKKEFAAQTGQNTKTLATYINRSKVVVNKNGLIDTKNSTNKDFISIHAWKKPEKTGVTSLQQEITINDVDGENEQAPVPAITINISDEIIEKPVFDSDYNNKSEQIPAIGVSEKIYKHHLAIKTKREAELKRLEIDKKRGIIIPSEPIKPVFLQHNQHVLMEQKNADEEMLTMFAHKYGISGTDVAYIRGEWVKRRNVAIKLATESTVNAIDSIIKDYIEKRGVGQKN